MDKKQTQIKKILNYISSSSDRIDLEEFIQWIMDYDLYSVLYFNWDIIKAYINYHDSNLSDLNKKHNRRSNNVMEGIFDAFETISKEN